jgi:hypothetical protein
MSRSCSNRFIVSQNALRSQSGMYARLRLRSLNSSIACANGLVPTGRCTRIARPMMLYRKSMAGWLKYTLGVSSGQNLASNSRFHRNAGHGSASSLEGVARQRRQPVECAHELVVDVLVRFDESWIPGCSTRRKRVFAQEQLLRPVNSRRLRGLGVCVPSRPPADRPNGQRSSAL